MEEKQLTTTSAVQLMHLPKDIIQLIASFLDKKALFNFRLVNQFFEIITSKHFLRIAASNHIAQIVCSDSSSYVIKADGTFYAWGKDICGELGLDAPGLYSKPTLSKIDNIVFIAAGKYHVLAITKNRNVCIWGNNSSPQVIMSLKSVASIAAGEYHSLAVTKDGTLYVWGSNYMGQLGLGHNDDRKTPQEVTSLKNVASIKAGGDHSLAVTQEGTLYAWGYNYYGQLGLGHNNNCNIPQGVTSLNNIDSVVAGKNHSLAVNKKGTLFSWGSNILGQLGLGHNNNCNMPQEVTHLSNVMSIAAGSYHSVAVNKDGALYAWGNRILQKLELRSFNNRISYNTPQMVNGLTNFKSIATGGNCTLAVAMDGTLYAWRNNNLSGNNSGNNSLTPTLTSDELKFGLVTEFSSFDCLPFIIKSIARREHRRQSENPELLLGTKQALLNQLDTFLLSSGALNSNALGFSLKFFTPKTATKLGQDLKAFIEAKNSIKSIEKEIAQYRVVNGNNDGAYKDEFHICLCNMLAILEQAKYQSIETIEMELMSIASPN